MQSNNPPLLQRDRMQTEQGLVPIGADSNGPDPGTTGGQGLGLQGNGIQGDHNLQGSAGMQGWSGSGWHRDASRRR